MTEQLPEGTHRCAVCGENTSDGYEMSGGTYICRPCFDDTKRFVRINRQNHGDDRDEWTYPTCSDCGKHIRGLGRSIVRGRIECDDCCLMNAYTVYAGPAYYSTNQALRDSIIHVGETRPVGMFLGAIAQTQERAQTVSVICPSCGKALESVSNFCPECGAKLLICRSCGAAGQDGRFCTECGAKLHD